jgi:hypothetical protein
MSTTGEMAQGRKSVVRPLWHTPPCPISIGQREIDQWIWWNSHHYTHARERSDFSIFLMAHRRPNLAKLRLESLDILSMIRCCFGDLPHPSPTICGYGIRFSNIPSWLVFIWPGETQIFCGALSALADVQGRMRKKGFHFARKLTQKLGSE